MRPFSPLRNELNTEFIDYFFEENENISTRRAENELGVSRRSIGRMLHDLHYHPYKIQLTQELGEEDFATRMEFSHSQLDIISREPNFADRIFFSDEALFHQHGGVHRHNFRYWAKENPHVVMQQPVNSPHLHVWAGACTKGVIGPFFFDDTVKATNYGGKQSLINLQQPSTNQCFSAMLREFALPQLHQMFRGEEEKLEEMIFMQDGASPHFGGLPFLHENFEDRWMGRGTRRFPAPYPWPPRSPDLTVMDFFFWGYLKSRVYTAVQYQDLGQLRQAIEREFREVPLEMIQRSIREGYSNRLRCCITRNGRQVEPY